MRAFGFLLFLTLTPIATAGEKPPAGTFTNAECLVCHEERDAKLVNAWRASGHARAAPKADCVACHGAAHAGGLARARRDSACVGCHEKLRRAVVHSYATSKHAIIVGLEADQGGWSRPLTQGNYRAPGCAYCHLHRAEHDTSLSVTSWKPFETEAATVRESAAARRQTLCGECHAPRYVTEQFATGARMQEIARMKLREARDVMARYQEHITSQDRQELEIMLRGMESHGRNVRLGTGHQSPDYQWWHGQPALDGDLLRIKGMIAGQERRRLAEKP